MRIVRFNREFLNEPYIILGCMMFLMIFSLLVVLRLSLAGIMQDCGTEQFLTNLCAAVETRKMEGGACLWLCDPSENYKNRKSISLCSRTTKHDMEDSLFASTSSKSGPVFAMDKAYTSILSKPYTLYTTKRPIGDTFNKATSRVRAMFRSVLDAYLNAGPHDALLNSINHPTQEPIPDSYVQSNLELLGNRRFILSLLFYGSGDRSMEVPGSATESIPAVSLDYTCAGVYQTFNLVNNTTPVSEVLNKSSTKWTLGASINVFHLYETVLHILDMEETTSEHEHEGIFYLCNLNTSQLLLHNDCVKPSQSDNFMLSHPCTMKALDISKIIYSEDEVGRRLSKVKCTSDKQCRFHSCQGVCSNGSCQSSVHTAMSGILQICQLLHSIESQILEEANDEVTKGQFYNIIDRCMDLAFFPDTVVSSVHHYALYNNVFQELKSFFFRLHDAKSSQLKERTEKLAARKEASKQAAERNKAAAEQQKVGEH